MQDAVAKGRQARGMTNGRRKIDEATVIAIRNTIGQSQSHLAKLFGVSQATISMIKNRRNWRHI